MKIQWWAERDRYPSLAQTTVGKMTDRVRLREIIDCGWRQLEKEKKRCKT